MNKSTRRRRSLWLSCLAGMILAGFGGMPLSALPETPPQDLRETPAYSDSTTVSTPFSYPIPTSDSSLLYVIYYYYWPWLLIHSTAMIFMVCIMTVLFLMNRRRKQAIQRQHSEIAGRIRVEKELIRTQEVLEEKVRERTAELAALNASLHEEIAIRKQTEKALQDQRRDLEYILDTVPAAIFFKDKENRVLRINRYCEKVLNVSRKEIEGRSIYDLTSDREQAENYWQSDLHIIESGQSIHRLFEPLHLPGETRWFQTTKMPYFDGEGNIVGILGFSVDVTEQKKTLDALEDIRNELEHRVAGRTRELAQANEELRLEIEERHLAEERLRESEERYRGLFEQAADGIILVDAQTRQIAEFNESAASNLGYSREELAKLRVDDLEVGQNPEELPALFQAIISAGSTHFETSVRTKSGDRCIVLASARAISLRGQPYLLTILRDVTARKQAEEDRDRLFNFSFDMFSVADFDGVLHQANPAWRHTLGWTFEELLGLSFPDLIHPDDLEKTLQAWDVAISGQPLNAFTNRCRCRDGGYRWISWNVFPLLKEKLLFSVGRDVTVEKETEEALQKSEQRLALALWGADLALWDYDIPSKRIFANERCCDLLGLRPEDMEYNPERWIATIHPEDRPRMIEAWKAHIQGETPFYESEYRIRIKTGEWLWILDRGRVVERDENNRAVRMTGTHLDISGRIAAEEEARRRQEQLRQADKMISLGILVSGIAHEINNPNHFIMSHVAPLMKVWQSISPILSEYHLANGDFAVAGMNYTEAQANVPAMLEAIQEGSVRIKTIVDELRDYAREQPISGIESVQINRVIRSAVTLLSNMIKRSTNCFDVEYGEEIPKLRGNYQRLEQVTINLIQNACESLTHPDQRVHVKTGYLTESHEVIIEIRDEGTGIPETALSHITDPFFTTKRDSGGTGLGLSISSNIVHEHCGVIAFRSEPGHGTTATVRLPVEPEAALVK